MLNHRGCLFWLLLASACGQSDPDPAAVQGPAIPALGTTFDAARVCHGLGALPPAVSAEATGWMRDVTGAAGLPAVRALSASARDVTGNGFPDVLLTADAHGDLPSAELWINCQGRHLFPVSLEDRVQGDPLLFPNTASTLADADGDGDLDILLGGHGQLQLLINQGSLTFRAQTWDFRGRTFGDLAMPDTGIASTIAVFDLDGDGLQDVVTAFRRNDQKGLSPQLPPCPDVVLRGQPGGTFADVTADLPAIAGCSSGQTFAIGWIDRRPFGLDPLLHLGIDGADDCLFRVTQSPGALPTLIPVTHPFSGLSEVDDIATMGVDHAFLGDDGSVLIALTEIGQLPLMRVAPDDTVTNWTHHLAYGDRTRVGWGLTLDDVNRDGLLDLVAAFGTELSAPEGLVEFLEGDDTIQLLNSLRLYLGVPHGTDPHFADVGPAAGIHFSPARAGTDDLDAILAGVSSAKELEDRRYDYYSLANLDFDRDGCADLLVGSRLHYDRESLTAQQDLYRYGPATVMLLRGHCPAENRWLGLILPPLPGTTARLTWRAADGSTRTTIGQVRPSPGVAAIGEPEVLRFGLGPGDAVPQTLTVTWPDGSTTTPPVDAGWVGVYTPVQR